MERTTDTIAAVATPAGPGAIGILRLSGPEAVSAASAAFRAADSRPLEAHPPRRLIYGDLLDREGAVIDKVLATYTRGPASYTGEDTAELHCHGAPMVLSLGLESLFSHGARQAGRGSSPAVPFLTAVWIWCRRRRWAICWKPPAGRGPATPPDSCPGPCPGGSAASTPPW